MIQAKGMGRMRMRKSVMMAMEISPMKNLDWSRQFGLFPLTPAISGTCTSQYALTGWQVNIFRNSMGM